MSVLYASGPLTATCYSDCAYCDNFIICVHGYHYTLMQKKCAEGWRSLQMEEWLSLEQPLGCLQSIFVMMVSHWLVSTSGDVHAVCGLEKHLPAKVYNMIAIRGTEISYKYIPDYPSYILYSCEVWKFGFTYKWEGGSHGDCCWFHCNVFLLPWICPSKWR